MNKWITEHHGMELTPVAKSNRRDNENGILILVVYLMMKDIERSLTRDDKVLFNKIVKNLKTHSLDGARFSGLFDRGADESLTIPPKQRRTISHDNITAIVAMSHLLELQHHKRVYQHGVENSWRFDNVYPDAPRWSRVWLPRDIIYYARLGGSKLGKSIAWAFMWYFYAEILLTCWKHWHVRPSLFHRVRTFLLPKQYPDSGYRVKSYATSGKQLAFVRMYPLTKVSWVARVVWKVSKWLINRHDKGGISGVFKLRYIPEHPIVKLVDKIKL